MERKLFCDISPAAYKISLFKCRTVRKIKNLISKENFSKEKSREKLPVVIYSHSSLIKRTLGNADPVLQENKKVNLSIAAPKVSGILIKPGETFSFWQLVGSCTKKKGYKEGLTISSGKTTSGIGGGMCQFTNLIHFMILHSPLEITEHHHHDAYDLFPDFGRKVPFGTGTSIMYNYLDYRFKNNTDQTFQLIITVGEKNLHGELRSERPLDVKYHIKAENEHFSEENGIVYRNSEVYRECIDKVSEDIIFSDLIRKNHAKVMYDTSDLLVEKN